MAEQETQPDLIRVEVVHKEEIFANRADLDVLIKGASLVSGKMALYKAREVGQLVDDLKRNGVQEKDIHLQGVFADVSSGMLGRSSAAVYHLRIHCDDLENLPNILGAVTAQKNTMLRSIRWGYKDDPEWRDGYLMLCTQRANEKARKIAEALGVRLLGVRNFVEEYIDPETPKGRARARDSEMDLGVVRRLAISSEDLGMEVSHSKEIQVRVQVEYRISDYGQG